jgi:hypothetical protein
MPEQAVRRRGRGLRPADGYTIQQIDLADRHLKKALSLLNKAGCPASVKKVQSAVKSVGGARRHAERRLIPRKEDDHA